MDERFTAWRMSEISWGDLMARDVSRAISNDSMSKSGRGDTGGREWGV